MNKHANYSLCALAMCAFLFSSCVNNQSPTLGDGPLTSYYVSQLDPKASDDNPGTAAKPFKTINAALKKLKLKPGDSIWIKNGVYREVINLQPKATRRWKKATVIPSGESYSRMITLAAFPGHKPVIKGSDVVKGWETYKDHIWVRNDWKVNSQQLFADGVILDQIGGKMGPGFVTASWRWKYKNKKLEDMIPGSFYYDVKTKKLYAWLKDNSDPNKHLMEASTKRFSILIGEGLKFIRLTGLTLRHGNNTASAYALGVHGEHCVIEDIDQAWHSFGGGHVGGEYLTFSRCKFNYNGNNGMAGRRRGHRVLDCETSYNNYRNWSTGWHAGGCKFIPYCHDWVLKGHIAHHNNGDGIWFDAWASNVTIEGCQSYRNKGCGIHYEISSRGVIKNNILYENGGRGIYLSNSSYCLVANNLCYKNGMSGIVSIGVNRKGPITYALGKEQVMPGGHNKVVGNILVDNCWDQVRDLERHADWGNRPELIMPHDAENNPGCFSDYNIFYRSGKRNQKNKLKYSRGWDMGFAHGLEQWREKTAWDQHSIYAKPLFLNEEKDDFHPTEKCPSLWFVAKPDMGIFYDFDGNLRPGWEGVRTAGPYAGEKKWYDKLKKNPKAGKFQMLPLPFVRRVDQFYHRARGLVKLLPRSLKSKNITALDLGFEIDGVPFIFPKGIGLELTNTQPEKVIKPKINAQKLYFLMTALDYGAKPFASCVISRGDGVKITVEWRGDGKGGISTVSEKNLATKKVWQGKSKYWHMTKKKHAFQQFSLYNTIWTNNNEWLPIEKCEFKLLDPKAKVSFLAITGEYEKK